ncbi:unnamed protein product [Zymoseptoria tritici ST99CH_1A5]|uniref:Uncharacterized protein n=1 Tax=Zymoseptoria tritici ST99CH_1A5 TaxID=1276529 RepID=A0A1Y6LH60_ZYMTR|nr:unnamed protein product [Zymoseptoria tritici ST99CH_1A5]
MWMQSGKHNSNPGSIAAYLMRRKVEFKLKTASGPERGALRQRVNEILQQEFDMYAAQARLDYQRKSEKLLGPVSADIEKRLHEYAKAPRPPKKDWKPCPTEDDFEKRLKPLINQIINAGEQKTGIKVPRGEDGCPFPGEEEDMPEGWGYWMCCVWFGRRLTPVAKIGSQLDQVKISKSMFDPDLPRPKRPKPTKEDTAPAGDDDPPFKQSGQPKVAVSEDRGMRKKTLSAKAQQQRKIFCDDDDAEEDLPQAKKAKLKRPTESDGEEFLVDEDDFGLIDAEDDDGNVDDLLVEHKELALPGDDDEMNDDDGLPIARMSATRSMLSDDEIDDDDDEAEEDDGLDQNRKDMRARMLEPQQKLQRLTSQVSSRLMLTLDRLPQTSDPKTGAYAAPPSCVKRNSSAEDIGQT